ncbi:MAG: LCP family protein [Clostridiales bacterium]|nr:LCP family protein [Clostridiales bacterium]
MHKKKRRRAGGFGRGLYRAAVILSAIIVALWCGWKLLTRAPDAAEPPPPAAAPDSSGAGGEMTSTLARKEKTWTFLLAAEDQVSGSTDTIMVCTYDTVNQKIGLVSIPRDTLVDRPGWRYHKINAAYPNGNLASPPDGGISELKDAVSEVLGIPIDHYILADTKIFVEIVDAVGGVDFDVPVHMSYDAPDQDLHIHFEPGMQHLTGQQALEVVRCRKNSDGSGSYPHNIYDAYPDADIGRTRTQQEMVKAIAKKVLSKPQKAGSYIEIFSQYVKTDLSLANLLWFVEPALGFDFSGLTTATLPGDGSARYEGTSSCYALDVEGSLEIINACLNPYTTPVTEDMVRMVQGQ